MALPIPITQERANYRPHFFRSSKKNFAEAKCARIERFAIGELLHAHDDVTHVLTETIGQAGNGIGSKPLEQRRVGCVPLAHGRRSGRLACIGPLLDPPRAGVEE